MESTIRQKIEYLFAHPTAPVTPATAPPRRRGQPPRHSADRFRTRVWYAVVEHMSGGLSPSELAALVEGAKERSRKWAWYRSGERLPKRWLGRPSAVDLAEVRFPGSARYFHSPLWSVLRGDPIDIRWLDEQLFSLDQSVVQALFVETTRPGPHLPPMRPFDYVQATWLSLVEEFDALTAAVLLLARAELTGDKELHRLAWESYLEVQPELEVLPPWRTLATELFNTIDTRVKRWIYPRKNERHEVVLLTQELRSGPGRVDHMALYSKIRELKDVVGASLTGTSSVTA